MLCCCLVSLPALAQETLPSVDEPTMIDRERASVEAQIEVLRDLVAATGSLREARYAELRAAELQPFGAAESVASLRLLRTRLGRVETRLSALEARRHQVAERLLMIERVRAAAAGDAPALLNLRHVVREVGLDRLDRLQASLRALAALQEEAIAELVRLQAIAAQHLALGQARLRLGALDDPLTLEEEPRIQLLGRIVNRLVDESFRLQRQAAALAASAEAPQARITELELAGALMLTRSNLRLIDIGLVQAEQRLATVASIADDRAMPSAALEDATASLARLDDRLHGFAAEIDAEAARLATQREFAAGAETMATGSDIPSMLTQLDALIAMQRADIEARRAALAEWQSGVAARLAARRVQQLGQHVALPAGLDGWTLVGWQALHLPRLAALGAWQGLGALGQQLRLQPAAGWLLLLAIGGLGLWLARAAGRDGGPALAAAVPPLLALAVGWQLAWPSNVVVAATGLATLPAVAAFWRAGRVDGRLGRPMTIFLVGFTLVLGLGALPLSPAMSDLLDRLAFLLLAILAVTLARAAQRRKSLDRTLGIGLRRLRLPPALARWLPLGLAALIVLTALAALLGYTPLAGFVLGRGAATVATLVAVVMLAVGVDRGLRDLVARLRWLQGPARARAWRDGTLLPAGRIAEIGLALVTFDLLARLWLGRGLPITIVAIAVLLGMLPFALRIVDGVCRFFMTAGASDDPRRPVDLQTVVVQRFARATVILGSALGVTALAGIGTAELLAGDTFEAALVRRGFELLAIVLLADLVWQVVRTAIERKELDIAPPAVEAGGEAPTADDPRRARLRTLLPILRNLLAVVILVTAILMVLSSLGIQIAPLIAGAGVVGVAVGFGAQTLVKDVISGVFYLLDDAFRVGEYIVADNYKGTVESFSLRSIKLRHHRGSLYTIPFGSLGAVQNMSRDWVVDILTFTVVYGSDPAQIKRVIKQVSKEMMADPETAEGLLQPIKSQGVDALGDHGMSVRVKFMAKPGTQFPIRRKAYAAIHKAFAEHGIEIAVPTVRIAGDVNEATAAAAQAALAPKAAE